MRKNSNSPGRKRPTGVTLEYPVRDYLDQLARKEDRTRSLVINRVVKDHASRNGNGIETATSPGASGMTLSAGPLTRAHSLWQLYK